MFNQSINIPTNKGRHENKPKTSLILSKPK
jgi:hypothetical protein